MRGHIVNWICIFLGLVWIIGWLWTIPPNSIFDVIWIFSIIPVFVVYLMLGHHTGIVI